MWLPSPTPAALAMSQPPQATGARRIGMDRSDLSYQRFFVSKPT
jgi:hypothetical protein